MNFIERNTKKVALVVCLATAASGVTTVFAAQDAEGWHGSGSDRVYKVDGNVKASSWVFDKNGTYYVNAKGNPVTSTWKDINGKKYYFDAEGKKVVNTTVIDGKRYFFGKDGVLPTGWSEAKDAYFNEFGVKVTGIQTIDGKTYNFGDAGKLQQGWAEVDGKKVYFNNGALADGAVEIDGKEYNFNSDGTITTGWKTIDGEKAYYDEYGKMLKGWQDLDGKKYFFNKDGLAATDTEYAGYDFDADGVATEHKEEVKEEVKADTTNNGGATGGTTTDGSSNTGTNAPAANLPAANSSIAAAALAQVGVGQDCTMLVTNALAAVGINFHGWPADYMSLGSITSDPQPGDLIYYANGGTGLAHIAVYIGNGQAVHGGWLGGQTVVASAYVGSGPVFIRVAM